MEPLGDRDSERFGKRTADTIGSAVDAAGQKLDAAVDYVECAKQHARETLNTVRQDGLAGMKERVMAYTRTEPFTALIVAAGTGLLVGWLAKKTRG